jgi:spore coat protein CotH
MLRFLVPCLALAACGGPDPVVYEPWTDTGTSDDLYRSDVIPEIALEISPDGVASLEAEPRTWVQATIVFEGLRYGPVGVRLKGQNSFLPFSEKPSLRIKIDEYIDGVTFHGLKDMTLNNMSTDTSMMHERLAYFVAREAGIPASRCNHVVLTVNGQLYGLYANVETVKPRMLSGWFDDNNGSLFEAADADFQPQYVGFYELKSGPDDRSGLEGLSNALAIAGPEAAMSAAGDYIDLAHFQRFWGMEAVIGQFDAFPYSLPGDDYFVYDDPTSGQLWLLPWGMDETFFAADFSPLMTNSILAARCKESPTCYQQFIDSAWDIQTMTEDLGLEAERARIEAQIAPLVAADTRKPYTDAEVTEGQTQLGYFIRGRRETLGGFLPPPSAPAQ